MYNRTTGVVPAPAADQPTSLLDLVAGEFALRVARLWPAPHAEFLTAPAARRHLVCLAMALGRDVDADVLLNRRTPAAVAAAVGETPAGVARAVTRMGELAWSAEGYRRLLRLLSDPKAAKALRHAEAIGEQTVLQLAAMPAPMSGAAGLAIKLEARHIELLGEAYAALRMRDGTAAADRIAAGWSRFETPKALFEAVKDDLRPEPAIPPHLGAGRLRPLTTKAQFREAARRYRNCLVDQTPHAASGLSAYYEWMGEPGAMVEICRDHVFGWRLEQARIAGNAPVPEALRDEIVSELALMGVHVGRSGWELERALRNVDRRWTTPALDEVVAEVFGAE